MTDDLLPQFVVHGKAASVNIVENLRGNFFHRLVDAGNSESMNFRKA